MTSLLLSRVVLKMCRCLLLCLMWPLFVPPNTLGRWSDHRQGRNLIKRLSTAAGGGPTNEIPCNSLIAITAKLFCSILIAVEVVPIITSERHGRFGLRPVSAVLILSIASKQAKNLKPSIFITFMKLLRLLLNSETSKKKKKRKSDAMYL